MPYIGYKYIRFGKKKYTIPFVLKTHRRFIMINKWLIRDNKNKYNTRGVNLNDICKTLNDILLKKGPILKIKKEYFKIALNSRYMLSKYNRGKSQFKEKRLLYRIKKKEFRKEYIKNNLDYRIKGEYLIVKDRLELLLKSILFLKSKNKKKYKNIKLFLKMNYKKFEKKIII